MLRSLVIGLLVAAAARAAAAPSCLEDAGRARATALVNLCKMVTAATHPPCHAGNSCAIILSSIRHDCANARVAPGCARDGATLADGARSALAAWASAQNQGHADDYFALYDPVRFVGIKRTAGGAIKRYDFAAWKAERARMLGAGTLVRADQIVVHDVDSDEDVPGLDEEQPVAVDFVQRWRSPRYADHGHKRMRWGYRQGRLRIVYEEMVDSAGGWDDRAPWARLWLDDAAAPATAELDGRALVSPIALRVLGEALAGDEPPRGLLRVVLRDAAGSEREIGVGPLLHVDEGALALGPAPRLFEQTFWWAGGGTRVRLEQRGETLVVVTSDVQEVAPDDKDAPPELPAKTRVRIQLAPHTQLRAAAAAW